MKNESLNPTDAKLDEIANLLRMLVAIEMHKGGMTREAIGKRMHVSKATVVGMLKGFQTEVEQQEKKSKGAK